MRKGIFNVLRKFSVRFGLKSGKICKNNDNTCFFIALTLTRSLRRCLNTQLGGLMFKQLPWDLANVDV